MKYLKIFLQLQIPVQVHCVKVTTFVSMATGWISVTTWKDGLDLVAQVVISVRSASELPKQGQITNFIALA